NEAALAAGAVVSCTLTNWVCVLLLPWLSLKVQVIVWSPWPKGPATSATPVIGPSQASVAVGAAGRVAEHWAITSGSEAASAAGEIGRGSCRDRVWVLVLAWLSLKVQVIVWSPWPKGPGTSATPVIGPSQASVAVGVA